MAARIARLDAWPIDVPLKKPFGIAGGAQDVARNVFVRVTLDDATVGYGEAAPFPAFNGETQASTLAAIDRARGEAMAAQDVPAAMRRIIEPHGAARCAIEMAVLDADARRRGRRLFDAEPGDLRTDVTIPIGPIDECAADARAWEGRGFTRLKVKVGGAGADDAFARAIAVHEAAPGAELIIDGNAGLSAEEAIALLRALERHGVRLALLEQPCPKDDVAGLVAVARASDVPVALDESVSSASDLAQFGFDADADLARRFVVNLKPMKAGLAAALEVGHAARRLGLGLMIGGMVETRMAMGASACLVLGHRGTLDFRFVDLDTPLFLASDPVVGGYEQDGECIDLAPITAGHGAVPREQP
jgi:L-alanine-DL-glutamate epimerase-like enolase superfamily enzyme